MSFLGDLRVTAVTDPHLCCHSPDVGHRFRLLSFTFIYIYMSRGRRIAADRPAALSVATLLAVAIQFRH
jgi:hypothetical protein